MKLLSIDRALGGGLAPQDLRRLRRVASMAARHGRRVWLVGGPLRDLLLGRQVIDLDLAVDGPVGPIGRDLAGELQGTFRRHTRFSTGTVRFEGGHLDLAETRTESYSAPAALPDVRPGTIEDDLARRDFTINAMALEIRPRTHGALLDPFEGRVDLRAGKLRVLHDRSFHDDPTRIFRAARFAARFEFHVERRTAALLRDTVGDGGPLRLSGERVAAELRHALSEERPARVFGWLRAWELGASWAAPASPTSDGRARLRHAVPRLAPWIEDPEESVALHLASLFHDQAAARRRAIAERLKLRRTERRLLTEGIPAARKLLRRLARASGPVAIDEICVQADRPTRLLVAALASPPVFRKIRHWWDRIRPLRLEIDGHDLRRAGLAPGPAHARALRAARNARIEGRATTREAQLAAALCAEGRA